jgi:hypothetical protein
MEDNLKILANGKEPQYFVKWKTTLIFLQMEKDLYIWQMEDHFNILANGRRPQYVEKSRTTPIFCQMKCKASSIFLENGR